MTPTSVVAAIEAAQATEDEEAGEAVAGGGATAAKPAAAKRERAPKGANKNAPNKLYSPAWNTSKFRGVTKHRRSGRWEAHIWIGKGVNKQIYLGGYEKEEHAAEAYDMAALKTKGFETPTNFSKDRCASVDCVCTRQGTAALGIKGFDTPTNFNKDRCAAPRTFIRHCAVTEGHARSLTHGGMRNAPMRTHGRQGGGETRRADSHRARVQVP